MKIEKKGKKWIVKGDGKEWIYNKTFLTKWKAEVAVEVFKEGGRVSDYWNKLKEINRPIRGPYKALKIINDAFEEIKKLNPTCEEIEKYGDQAEHGEVTITDSKRYFPPKVHNTYGKKAPGRVHIDLGYNGVHLMLDKKHVNKFITFIKNHRENNK